MRRDAVQELGLSALLKVGRCWRGILGFWLPTRGAAIWCSRQGSLELIVQTQGGFPALAGCQNCPGTASSFPSAPQMYRAALAKGGKYKAGAPYPPPAAVAAAEAAAAKAAAPLVPALRHVLTADPVGAAEFGAWALNLPGDMGIYERDDGDGVDPGMLQVARQSLERALAAALRPELGSAVLALDAALGVDTAAPGGPTRYAVPYAYSAQAAAQRSMRQAALHLLAALGEPAVLADLQVRAACCGIG